MAKLARMLVRRLRLALALCVVSSGTALAQGTSAVAASDPSYADIDRLDALGVLDTLVRGQRPYSRREIARLVARARGALSDSASSASVPLAARVEAGRIIERLGRRFGPTPEARGAGSGAHLDEVALVALVTDAPTRPFSGTFASALGAGARPFASTRLGPIEPRGATAGLEVAGRLEVTPWLGVTARGRFEGGSLRGGGTLGRADVLLASARGRIGNAAVTAGREQLGWATAPGAGLFISSRAPALDLFSVTSDRPFLLPGLLRVVGPTRATIVVADLGPTAVRSHSKLLAYKVSASPARGVEVGATFLDHFGGAGARRSSLGDQLIDFLPFVDLFRTHNYSDTTRTLEVDSDKMLGVDGRVVVRPLAGLVLAGELLIDDFDVHRVRTLLTWDGSQSLDLLLPRVASAPLALRAAVRHTGVRTYTHGSLANGLTTRGRLIGEALGPDAKSFSVGADWHREPGALASIDLVTALRSSANYVVDQTGDRFVIRRSGPAVNEQTDAVVASLVSEWRHGVTVQARAGAARIRHAEFSASRRWAHLVELSLRLIP